MTACVNRKHTKKVAAVVTASLVGALSLGVAPITAVAETGIETLAATAADDFNGGKIELAENEFTCDGNAVEVEISSIQTKTGKPVNIDGSDDYKVYYVKADAKGNPTDEVVAEPVDAGEYCVVVEAVSGDYEGGKLHANFTIAGMSLKGAKAYDGDDKSEAGEFTYDAEAADVEFKASDDTKLTEGKDYTVKYYKQGEDFNNSAYGTDEAPTNAGDYYARLTGMGKYAGSVENVVFSIDPYKITKEVAEQDIYVPMVVGDATVLPSAPETVKGSKEIASQLKLTYNGTPGDADEYKAKVVLVDENNSNIEVEKDAEVTVYKVSYGVDFAYDGEAIPEAMIIDKSKKQKFDSSKLEASYTDASGEVQDLTVTDANIYVTKANGDSASVTDLNNSIEGKYVVTVEIAPDTAYTYGGKIQFTVTINAGTIDCDESLFVTFGGKTVSSISTDYTGNDIASGIKTALYNDNTPLKEGTDYTVTFKNSDGEKVTGIKNAGEYTMGITSDKYVIENGTFDITVNKVKIAGIKLPDDILKPVNGQDAVLYNGGDEIELSWLYNTGKRDENGKLLWKDVADCDVASITIEKDGKKVDKVKDLGTYTATITLKDVDAADNYEVTAEPYTFTVAETLQFLDVTSDAWYFDYINKAVKNQYMGGYENSKLFGPMDNIKRGDVAVVLYKMAGSPSSTGSSAITPDFETGFTDVDSSMYYAEAIAWAKNAGIVSGDTSTGLFRPEDNISRQELAKMFYVYAEKTGQDVDVDTDAVLAEYDDANTVADWAKDYVAWAVDAEVMGQGSGLRGSDPITRAEVATMAVRVQPHSLIPTE